MLITVAALWGTSGCTEGISHLGGDAGEAGTRPASGGEQAEGGSASASGGREGATGGKGGRAAGGASSSAGAGGKIAGGAGGAGGSETGGNSAQGGLETGGSGAEGGVQAGGKSSAEGGAGAPSAGASGGTTCVVPPEPKFCNDDSGCNANEYCAGACVSSGCSCRPGGLVCKDDCRDACVTSVACDAATPLFTDQLSGEHCTVMLRYTGSEYALTGYAVDCGPVIPMTEQEALNRLLPMASIQWSGATAVGDPERTGVYSFTTLYSGRTYTGFISAKTGRLLTIIQVDADGLGSFRLELAWRSPAELGTYCGPHPSANWFVQIPTGDGLGPSYLADAKARASGVFDGLRAKFGHVGPAAVVNVDRGRSEELMFVSAP